MAIADHQTSTMTTAYWHPFADMGAVAHAELLLERGEGVYVLDGDGKRYIDATASLWYATSATGARTSRAPSPRQMTGSTRTRLRRLLQPPANALAARLAALAPIDDAKVFLASGGGDAIDTAAKSRAATGRCRAGPSAPTSSAAARLPRHARVRHGLGGIEANALQLARWCRTRPRSRTTRCRRSSRRSCASGRSASRPSSASP